VWHEDDSEANDGKLTAGMLATPTPPLNERTTCGEIFDWFAAHPDVSVAAMWLLPASAAGSAAARN